MYLFEAISYTVLIFLSTLQFLSIYGDGGNEALWKSGKVRLSEFILNYRLKPHFFGIFFFIASQPFWCNMNFSDGMHTK